MSNWKPLDLIHPDGHPKPGQLVALRLIPSNEESIFSHAKYDIGEFRPDFNGTGRKLWWHGTHGCQDPTHMKKRYNIFWCILPHFDAL